MLQLDQHSPPHAGDQRRARDCSLALLMAFTLLLAASSPAWGSTILTPAGWGDVTSYKFESAFDAQPTWSGQVPLGGDSGFSEFQASWEGGGRVSYIDLGEEWADWRITQTWTKYVQWRAGTGAAYAELWWDNDTDAVNDGLAESRLNFNTRSHDGSGSWLRDVDVTTDPVIPRGRYLLLKQCSTPGNDPVEALFVGYMESGPPANAAPAVNAGSDRSIRLPVDSVYLDATVQDDGLPAVPGTVTVQWSQISGPAMASFSDAQATDTTVIFPEAGVYLLRLTASDGELAGHDDVCVTLKEQALPGAENWSGYMGGNLHHNSSPTEIDPARLAVLWQRSFGNKVDLPSAYPGWHGSRNLVTNGSRLALVAADCGTIVGNTAYVTILDAATGITENVIRTNQGEGPQMPDHRNWPTGPGGDAHDTAQGIHVAHWDATNDVLYLAVGGDHCSRTAYKPLDNLDTYTPGGFQPAVYAFGTSDTWYLGIYGSTNNTAFFEVDPDSNLISAGNTQHLMAGKYATIDKNTGAALKDHDAAASAAYLVTPPDYSSPPSIKVFGHWGGTLLANGRAFLMGPGDDNGPDGFLGYNVTMNHEWGTPPDMDDPDQGLCLVGSSIDEYGNDTVDFVYRFLTPHKPENGPADCESYLEMDGFFRNKAWLVDSAGAGVWCAWKQTQADGVQLMHCDENDSEVHNLQVCQGMRGQDIWPHVSLAGVGSAEYLVYYAGNAWNREVVQTKPFTGDDYKTAWSATRTAPLGSAQMAVFNTTTRQLAWTCDLSALCPDLPPNDFWSYFDSSHLVVAGKWAYVGWVDLSQGNATLKLKAFDITETSAPSPVEFAYDLGFPAATNRKTRLFDLIAVNGNVFALVTQSDVLMPDNHDWTAQHVIALAAPSALAHPGDFNGDGTVSGADYVIWANNFDGSDSSLAPGSHNNDGVVSGADYVIWASNFGTVAE